MVVKSRCIHTTPTHPAKCLEPGFCVWRKKNGYQISVCVLWLMCNVSAYVFIPIIIIENFGRRDVDWPSSDRRPSSNADPSWLLTSWFNGGSWPSGGWPNDNPAAVAGAQRLGLLQSKLQQTLCQTWPQCISWRVAAWSSTPAPVCEIVSAS